MKTIGGHVEEALKARRSRPEFLNRIDDTIVFTSLREHDLLEIVDLQLARLRRRSPSGGSTWSSRSGQREADRGRVRPRVRRATAQARDPAPDPGSPGLSSWTARSAGRHGAGTLEGDEILLQAAEVVVN
jgi:hypothetical protein